MEWDYGRKESKEQELRESLQNFLVEVGVPSEEKDKLSELIFDSLITVTPPEKERQFMEFIALSPSGRGGGRSIKPGNITLNINNLFEAISSGVFTAISVSQTPWAIPFAAVLLWGRLLKNMQIQISENEAVVLWVMWKIRNSENIVNESDIKPAIDEHSLKYQRSTLSTKDVEFSLSRLCEISSIDKVKGKEKSWWLREWIKPVYR